MTIRVNIAQGAGPAFRIFRISLASAVEVTCTYSDDAHVTTARLDGSAAANELEHDDNDRDDQQ